MKLFASFSGAMKKSFIVFLIHSRQAFRIMKRVLLTLIFTLILTVSFHFSSSAQCSLCKSSAESSLKEGDKQAKGLNAGIMYLLVMPYLLVGGIGYYWYMNQKKKGQPSDEGT